MPLSSSSTAYFDIKEYKIPACHIREYPGSTAGSQEDVLYLHVKQYTPLNNTSDSDKNAVTVVAMHGVGLPKELYEPLWDELYKHSFSKGYSIRGIWIADAVNQGLSGVLNEDKLSNDYSWMDHPRDILLMINQFRHKMPRPLIGIGHSFGGCQITNLAFLHPRLFSTLILLDPVIQLSPPAMGFGTDAPGGVNFTTHRKDIWQNRAAAAAWQRKVSKDWDSRVLDRMIQYGFRNLPTALYPDLPSGGDPNDPAVTLTTTKHQDALGQLRENFEARKAEGFIQINRDTHADMDPLSAFVPLYRPEPRSTFYRLPCLRPSTLWVLGRKTFLSLEEMHEGIKSTGNGVGGSGGLSGGKVQEIIIQNHGHLFPFTAVEETGSICAAWIGSEICKFQEQEAAWNTSRKNMSKADHMTLKKKWIEVVKPLSAFKTNL